MLASLVILAVALAPPQTNGATEWTVERLVHTSEVSPATTVEVHNPFGDLRCRPSGSRELRVLATVQHEPEDGCGADLVVEEAEGRTTIDPRFRGCSPSEMASRRRVDLVVFVPSGSPLRLQVGAGLLEARKMANPLHLVSDTGPIQAVVPGTVSVTSERGSVTLKLTSGSWSTPPQVDTLTGDISLQLPEPCNAVLDVDTAGHITTDYSIAIEPTGPGDRKRGVATLGSGGTTIRLTSGRGNITLLRPPRYR